LVSPKLGKVNLKVNYYFPRISLYARELAQFGSHSDQLLDSLVNNAKEAPFKADVLCHILRGEVIV